MGYTLPPELTDAQRQFLTAAESLGATTPNDARPITDLPRLAPHELDELVDRGLVREAAAWSYYVYTPRRSYAPAEAPRMLPYMAPHPVAGPRRWARTLLFWILIILIPILFLQLTQKR